ncbi:baseplate J/gp47 family protein [Arthrobacter sp. JSM 101049]|uniref:baseplate J/gp47 family protein n=1 Tax=Arthrobacter sp. JSM 101049 TaxID=929097 RepID=UPI00356A6D8D
MLDPDGAPDRELLAALAAEYSLLDGHLAHLGEATRAWWLRQVLGLDALPAVPDRIIARIEVDPKTAPVVLERGTILRGGTDAFGNERHYASDDTLTAHGAELAGVRSFVPGGPGRPHGVAASAPDFPLRPDAGPDGLHLLRIRSSALAFTGGHLDADVVFAGATGAAGLKALLWRWTRPDGTTSAAIGADVDVAGARVRVRLTGSCGAPAGQIPWVEGVLADGAAVPVDLSFTRVTVAVADRSAYVPEAAFYNDGAVDVTKEFQPFGAAAKRGDAFYLRSDEALGKSLDTLDVGISILQEGGAPLSASSGGSGVPVYLAQLVQEQLQSMKIALGDAYASVDHEWSVISDSVSTPTTPAVLWQRRQDGAWTTVGESSPSFATLHATDLPGAPESSEPFAVAGQTGHYLRAFLAEGDFGWTDYQKQVADFATQAVADGTPRLRPFPVPPIASSITLRYTTVPVAAEGLEATSGWRRQVRPGGTETRFRPFRLAIDDFGSTGMVAIGFDLPDTTLGASVSVYLRVDSAASCAGSGRVDATWQYWAGERWVQLPTADGTHQLREAGLLRFVAPAAWATGCPEVSAATGRWIRLASSQPERFGTLSGVDVDAVTATFASGAADPAADPSSAGALPAGTIKGTLTPVPGVKKATNVASVPGRAPEDTAGYLARASAATRHRHRWITPWDLEARVRQGFPEVAAVLCLPHTGADATRAPGNIALVLVPDESTVSDPRPSVSLATRIAADLAPGTPAGATVHVICPAYVPVTVTATLLLRRGIAALTGLQAVTTALETALHPGTAGPRWGRTLYASTLIALLEHQPEVDVVTTFVLHDGAGNPVEQLDVNPVRGLYCSSGHHGLSCQEQL